MRRRIVASTAAVVVAAVVAFALPLGIAVGALFETRALDEVQGTVEQLGLVLDVTSRDCDELRLRVAQLADGPLELTVLASGPRVVATTAADGRPGLGDELTTAAEGRVGRRADAGVLAVATPLTTDVCGTPLVLAGSRDDAGLRSQVRRSWLTVAFVALAVAALGTGSAWWVGRNLSRPFEALEGSARRLGDGDFSARAPRSALPEADGIAEALDRTAARLGRALARSAAFTSDASHQLRTPLTALRLQLESLAASGADPDALDAAMAEADRLEQTMEELVALTRVDAPEVEVDLAELVARLLPAWRMLAAEQGRTLEADLPPIRSVRVRPAAVTQALQVLVDNAIQHGAGEIRVTLRAAGAERSLGSGDGVSICVRDHGPGSDAVSRRPGGRGLPLVEALVAAEGGRLTFADADTAAPAGARGTSACIVLPAR